jgi:hypothetical protein
MTRPYRALARLNFDGTQWLFDERTPSGADTLFNFNSVDVPELTNPRIIAIFDRCVAELTRKAGVNPEFQLLEDTEGWQFLCAVWPAAGTQVVLVAGSGNDSNFAALELNPPLGSFTRRDGSRRMLETTFVR